MSSVNPYYTFEYSQPEAYRFSHDSVFLARQVFELYGQHSNEKALSSLRCLDLCAGCGIVGLDFIFHCKKTWNVTPHQFDFVEVQEIYRAHFFENLRRLGPVDSELRFVNRNYAELSSLELVSSSHYDLILCNPPYFRLGQGRLSPSEFKNRCRFFMDADFETLMKAIANSLTPQGNAFVLLRDLKEHGWNAFKEAQDILSSTARIEKIGEIRGTGLARIKRL